jgi:NAD(P)-dependent dehydrogenase (short-subunit alcohol dehydrogenase family)
MDQRLEGRIAMVTGAGRRGGIGAAIGHRLAREGATVVIADIDSSGAAAVASDIGGGRAIPVEMDVSSREHVQEVVASLRDALGGEITVLINNASVGDAVGPEGGTEEAWDRVLAVNVKGTVWCSEAVLPGMKDLRQGKIVNIASIAGHAARGAGGP